MRTLFLVRHAKSSWGNPGLRDHDRPLNDRGLHDAPKMAQLLVKHGVAPDLLITSPAKRALTTSLFFAEAFKIEPGEVRREANIYEAFPMEILRIISELPESASTVFLFGHNPTFTEVANRFSEDDFIENVPTCGVVKIASSAGSWKEFYEGNSKVAACFSQKKFYEIDFCTLALGPLASHRDACNTLFLYRLPIKIHGAALSPGRKNCPNHG